MTTSRDPARSGAEMGRALARGMASPRPDADGDQVLSDADLKTLVSKIARRIGRDPGDDGGAPCPVPAPRSPQLLPPARSASLPHPRRKDGRRVAEAPEPPVFEFGGTWPFNGQVKIAGHPVSSVTSFTVHAAPDGIPVVTLTLVGPGALRLLLAAGAADVRIPDETREALTALGWTPPSGT